MCPMITRFGCFFLRKCRCSELNCLLSEVLVTLPEEQRLSSDLLHPLDCFSTSQTSQIPNKIITAQLEICNPRINYDIEIKHGPVNEPDKRNRTMSKNLTMTSRPKIVTSLSFYRFMVTLEQFGSRIPEEWYAKLTFSLIVTFYLPKTENRTKKTLTSSYTIALSKGVIFDKKF